MKASDKITELDVDYIGGEGTLTLAQEQAISEYIKKNKDSNTKHKSANSKTLLKLNKIKA